MKMNLKNTKGITLIALVITIVILLIIAVIVISVTLRSDGLVQNTKDAKVLAKVAEYQEQIEMVKVEKRVEKLGNFTLEELNEALNDAKLSSWVNKTEIKNEMIYLTTNDGYLFSVDENATKYIGYGDVEIPDTILAEAVEFTPTDTNWKALDGSDITNVKQALDSLYGN